MEILTRADAFEIGSTKYFTGQPCKHGHVAERYTTTCVCTVCHQQANAKQMVRSTLRLQNVTPLTVKAHRDDHVTIEHFAWQLLTARGIKLPPPGPAGHAPAPTPDQPPLDINAQRWQMWTRLHGETIARQMFEQQGLTVSAPIV